MAITAELSDGTNTVSLIYDPGIQEEFAMHYGMNLGLEEVNVFQHTPDYGQPVPIRAWDSDRTVFAAMHVLGDDIDRVTDSLILLRRWVDGANQQALAYHLGARVNEITFTVKADGATNATVNSVKWGFIDDSGSFYTDQTRPGGFARSVIVMLHLEPYGRADTSQEMENALYSSPHFIEDSDGNGLADGWNLAGGASAGEMSIVSTAWLVGGYSQKVDVNADNEGIYSDYAYVSDNCLSAVAYAWVYVESGDVDVHLYDTVAPATLASVDATLDNADQTMVDDAGNTWWRIPIPQELLTVNHYVRLEIRAKGGAATFYVDACYIQYNTDTIPDMWCSSRIMSNRCDPSSGNETRINYFDMWGAKGDVPSILDMEIKGSGTASANYVIAAQNSDSEYSVATREEDQAQYGRVVWDGTDLTEESNTNATRTNPTDANRHGGEYTRYTATAADAEFRLYIPHTVTSPTGYEADIIGSCPKRWFLIWRSSSTTTTLTWQYSVYGYSTWEYASGPFSVQTAATWEMLDLGAWSPNNRFDAGVNINYYFGALNVENMPNGSTCDIDVVFGLNADYGDNFIKYYIPSTSGTLYTRGARRTVIEPYAFMGGMWTIPAGTITTRQRYFIYGDDYSHDLTDYIIVAPTVTYRTRHLLGTI